MTGEEKKKEINLFTRISRLLSCLLGIDHLPAPGQRCETCDERGHLLCFPSQGPDTEHLFIELDSIERRRAA